MHETKLIFFYFEMRIEELKNFSIIKVCKKTVYKNVELIHQFTFQS